MASAVQITTIPSRSSALGMSLAGAITLSAVGYFSHREIPHAEPNPYALPVEGETIFDQFDGLVTAPTGAPTTLTPTPGTATGPSLELRSGNADIRPSISDRAEELVAEIIDRKRAARDWSDRDGVAPPQSAFDEALAFVDLIASDPALAKLTRIYGSGDGEVGFVWRRSSDFLEVSFSGEGRIEWASTIVGRDDDGEQSFGSAREMTRLPQRLERILEQLT